MCIKPIKFFLLTVCLVGLLGKSTQATAQQSSYQIQIVAEDMCCKGCAQKVAGQLYAAPGVTAVDANMKNKTVTITMSQQQGASLEQLWQAVAAGEGGPSKLTTAEATFTFAQHEASAGNQSPPKGTTYVVIDNLHCKGCAQKIAAQFYTIRGVSKVNADMKQNTMIVKNNGQDLSPWALIGAVTNAKERPVAIVGVSGRMDIAWSTPKTTSAHQTSNQSNTTQSNTTQSNNTQSNTTQSNNRRVQR